MDEVEEADTGSSDEVESEESEDDMQDVPELSSKKEIVDTASVHSPPPLQNRSISPTASDEEPPESDHESTRNLSRSPPRSRSISPAADHSARNVKDIVKSNLDKSRARQQRKYHSKRSTRQAGRAQGSKAKQDTRVKLDSTWD